jgi:RsiW-degrading membrane proteinase PrsW (M82 family)
MNLLPIVMAAVAPGISLLAYFYLKDRYESEPVHLVVKMFLFGVILVFPTLVLQRAFINGFGSDHPFTFAFIASAGLEEFLKWFLLLQLIYKHAAFDEPYDGIVYAVAVSLGFATLENVFYAFFTTSTFSSLLLRAVLPVSGHAMFGVFMGYYMGKAKFSSGSGMKWLLAALLIPLFWHGLFDYIQLIAQKNWVWLMIPLMIFLWVRTLWKVDRANDRSPLRLMHREEEIKTG